GRCNVMDIILMDIDDYEAMVNEIYAFENNFLAQMVDILGSTATMQERAEYDQKKQEIYEDYKGLFDELSETESLLILRGRWESLKLILQGCQLGVIGGMMIWELVNVMGNQVCAHAR